jgi:hypothetical protein
MIHIYIWGFIFGTFKFLFSHWTIFGMAVAGKVDVKFLDIYIPTTAGAIFSMGVFYFLSELLMKRAAKKRHLLAEQARLKGITLPAKRKFTKLNKFMVRLKMKAGIYGITLLAPLFLSIPLGSIVCAKFYGHYKKTFPLMVIFMAAYSMLMCSLIYIVN